MKKKLRKIMVGVFAGLLTLQTAFVLPTGAEMIIGRVQTGGSALNNMNVKVSRNSTNPDIYNNLKYLLSSSNSNANWFDYDLTYLASTRSQLLGVNQWNFKIELGDIDSDCISYIILMDNKFNEIVKYNYYYQIERNESHTFSLQTNLKLYDLNYDGSVTSSDTQLALKMAITVIAPSDLQIKLGDTNGNNDIDMDDVTYIQKVALGII